MIIDLINRSDIDQKYIFITLLLSECHRIAGTEYDPNDVYKRPLVVNCNDSSIHYQYKEDAVLKNRLFKHPYFSRSGGKTIF